MQFKYTSWSMPHISGSLCIIIIFNQLYDVFLTFKISLLNYHLATYLINVMHTGKQGADKQLAPVSFLQLCVGMLVCGGLLTQTSNKNILTHNQFLFVPQLSSSASNTRYVIHIHTKYMSCTSSVVLNCFIHNQVYVDLHFGTHYQTILKTLAPLIALNKN